jgi:hypothetical protein
MLTFFPHSKRRRREGGQAPCDLPLLCRANTMDEVIPSNMSASSQLSSQKRAEATSNIHACRILATHWKSSNAGECRWHKRHTPTYYSLNLLKMVSDMFQISISRMSVSVLSHKHMQTHAHAYTQHTHTYLYAS